MISQRTTGIVIRQGQLTRQGYLMTCMHTLTDLHDEKRTTSDSKILDCKQL